MDNVNNLPGVLVNRPNPLHKMNEAPTNVQQSQIIEDWCYPLITLCVSVYTLSRVHTRECVRMCLYPAGMQDE